MKWEFINHMEKIYNLLQELEQEKSDRDYPFAWERVHATSCAQVGRLLARKRGADLELAALVCSLHDIGRWYTGRQKDHAIHGEEPVRRFLESYSIAETSKEEVIRAVIHHSEKDKVGSALEEIVKDADILDCYFHGDEVSKPHHVARLKKVMEELGL
ncbi:putative domain HDIG-containing protein [Desulfitobacterium dichloroeliminans LMG P-21439]|uniref:Putative domain HDIG-containing protein n=1 Tax=Desulfitobacterium dichloroeliminans (strain LMG P-21439 / DCA1) TaxID=871963 RepID=L0F8X6_DESDL|nr:HD domain-containing protein [Desulfitobacterium dichloroeliminans]AGA69091.1 putative domain HDIG-containing protein [Desulfitobacterium dichloroeliminans LMG P-21439]